MYTEIIIGLILIIDGIISIAFASPSRVTYNIFNLSSIIILYIGHFFRVLRIILGLLLIIFQEKFEIILPFLGIYLIIDAISSITTSFEFNKVDDWLRFIRLFIGGYLLFNLLA